MIGYRKSSIFNLQSSIPRRLAIVFFVLLIGTSNEAPAQTWHRVKWVNDGDTVVLTTGERVRYIGINAPEIDHKNQKAEPQGYQAKAFNQKLVLSQRIRFEYDQEPKDRYGRTLAYVFLEDGSFLNLRLLQAGLAFYLHLKPNLRYSNMLLQAQRKAMELKKGLWHNWREADRDYIGNRNSRRFHLASCPHAAKIKSKNKVHFSRKWDAFHDGYAPARRCIKEFWSY